MKHIQFVFFLANLWLVYCDWVEIPHITRNSHSYPEEHLEAIFLKPKTTLATIATTALPKKIYSKETFSEVLERPPRVKSKKQTIQRRKDNVEVTRSNNTHQKRKPNNPHNFSDENKEQVPKNESYYDVEYDEYEVEYEDEGEGEEAGEGEDEGEDKDEDDEDILKKNATTRQESKKYSDGLLSLLKNIQDSLIKTNQGSTSSKITFLQNLRDNLLYNLKEKIQNLWSSRSRRDAPHSREHKDEYHMDSHEGPLITIGFLTFAVYLIKLVLQLLNALKANQSIILFPTTTTTTAASLILGRRKRSEEIAEKTSKIMSMIDTFKEKNYGL